MGTEMPIMQVQDFEPWLKAMTMKPLPGGVAGAALVAAMGAALCAKAARITLQRQARAGSDPDQIEVALSRSQAQQPELLRLADADAQAYRAVLATRGLATRDPARSRAWQEATEVPLRVAEACRSLRDEILGLGSAHWADIAADFEIGLSFLETATRACLLAVESNLQAWGDHPEVQALRLRVDAVQEERS